MAATNSDCPLGQPGPQIGAYNFYDNNPATWCNTVRAYGYHNPALNSLAFTDYRPGQCPGCGTKSISINTAVAWSTNPGPGQYDIQSVVAHEFGHVLGFSHIKGEFCDENPGFSCFFAPNRNTMQSNTPAGAGETCGRDPNFYDITNANNTY